MKDESAFHLLPASWTGPGVSSLHEAYARAFSQARELYIVNAFLTEWPSGVSLNRKCETFLLVIGADFGTTRRAAVESALAWLPKRFPDTVLAFNQKGVNFHPKAGLWREHDGTCYFLIGSSNLTMAAFERNVEANVTLRLEEEEYAQALEWVAAIDRGSVVVNDQWLRRYNEAPMRGGGQGSRAKASTDDSGETGEEPVFNLALGLETATDRRRFKGFLTTRREQRTVFDARAKRPLLQLIHASVNKARWTQRDNSHFYDELLRLWAGDVVTRLGGLQWAIRGKHANHQELARSLLAVIDARPMERDAIVRRERDRLHAAGVTTRAAAMTELLCHFFPDLYPILDAPVRAWRSEVGFDTRMGGTEGERCIRLARAMRAALNDAGPRRLGIANLSELDTLIWYLANRAKL